MPSSNTPIDSKREALTVIALVAATFGYPQESEVQCGMQAEGVYGAWPKFMGHPAFISKRDATFL